VSGPYDVRLTQGHVLRHAPAQSPQGRDAAVIDIAQDLLLRHLSERGALTLVAFKGGTALRKVCAGAAGRFSTDLDFSVATLDDDPATVIRLFVDEIDGARLGPFTYGIDDRRGRYAIIYQSELGPGPAGLIQSKIDVGPPPWLAPTERSWVDVPIHSTPGLDLDRSLVRRLAVLKAWVDLHGLHTDHTGWSAPLPNARPFDVDRWLTPRSASDFDDEAIGLLTVPTPDLGDLGRELSRLYVWLGDLDDDERAVTEGRPQDRNLVLRLLAQLPGGRLSGVAR